MAIRKSELYSSLWASCDELRGGMDASQYKDYVLVLLFVKYISDRYADEPYAAITVPEGASFKDMVALKGKSDIGDQINKKIVGPLANANKLSDMPDFNDATKLGSGKEKVERLTNLIAIFENRALDFSDNRADGDDILGDAYEYLMRHFATQSGKSKGQFYTPAEVSRVIAQVLGIRTPKTGSDTTVYDPTCGSGSLLLKVADEARTPVTLYGQEKDAATSGLARMNMILHRNPTAAVSQGNTLTDPKFYDGHTLKTFDYVVANPPFSDKRWSTGLDPSNDPHERFKHFGVPPAKQGDYAYLLHIVRSLKSKGKGACILPHGVLFRGNAEADIRRNLVRKGYIKGIVGLPANLFYGTGIPACIVVIDKEDAAARKGIFMIDASAGFMKDGPKNRLRAQDIHKIVDVFNRRLEVPRYSRMVSVADIEKNEFNLNLPRYIDSRTPEDVQDIAGHLQGGIPAADVDALERYWAVCPKLRQTLFKQNRPGYLDLAVEKAAIKSAIYEHPEFAAFIDGMNAHFNTWREKNAKVLKALKSGCHPKDVISTIAEDLLAHYAGMPLIDPYDVYQHLMDYWAETMQDDCYLIAADGWKATTYYPNETDKQGKRKDKGWTCDLIPKPLIVARYFAKEQAAIDRLAEEFESASARRTELEEEHSGEDAAFFGFDKITKAVINERLKEISDDPQAGDEIAVLHDWLKLADNEAGLKKRLKGAEAGLDAKAYAEYPKLTEAETKELVVDDKWLAALDAAIHGEMDRVSRQITQRVKELAERYETPLPLMQSRVAELEAKVNHHLDAMQESLTGKKRLPSFSGEWEVRRLEDVADIDPENVASDAHLNFTFNYIALEDVDMGTLRSYKEHVLRTAPSRARRKLRRNDVLVSTVRPNLMSHLLFPIDSDNWVCSTGFCVVRCKEGVTHPGYVYFHMFAGCVARQIEALLTGSNYPAINSHDVRALQIPFPEYKEQAAIAAILSDIDAEITALEAKLAKVRSLKEGMMQELLTGRIRLV